MKAFAQFVAYVGTTSLLIGGIWILICAVAARNWTRRAWVASLLFAFGLISFGLAPILAVQAERQTAASIPIGALEGAQFGVFMIIAGVVLFASALFQIYRLRPR